MQISKERARDLITDLLERYKKNWGVYQKLNQIFDMDPNSEIDQTLVRFFDPYVELLSLCIGDTDNQLNDFIFFMVHTPGNPFYVAEDQIVDTVDGFVDFIYGE